MTDFKKIFFSTLSGTLLGGIIGIIIALNNGGVWALVFYYLCKVNQKLWMTRFNGFHEVWNCLYWTTD